MTVLERLFGRATRTVSATLQTHAAAITALEPNVQTMSDDALREALRGLRPVPPEHLDRHLPMVFAYVREAARRALGQRHYDVQLMGGIVLHQGKIAEMKTGEGKTLVETLPATLNALTNKGVHIVTVNDYLAKRDAHWMGAVFDRLGLTVGAIEHEASYRYDRLFNSGDATFPHLKPVERREAYAADVLYGTNNEFGFDYLRDNMVSEEGRKVQRPLQYAIVDEVDSILIDEARTPLIISAPAEDSTDQYYRYAQLVRQLSEGEDYNIDEKLRAATLTEQGLTKMERLLGVKNIYEVGGVEMAHHLEQALKALTLFKRDVHYVVREGQVVIVDEFTGRLMFGRRYSEGLHQAIEAKEGVSIQQESQTLATITFQNYFRLYAKLAGMTGTAATEAEEFAKIYNLDVVDIPTHRPMVRRDLSDAVFGTETGKYQAVVREIKRRHELGQPILVGTISIEKNELLHELLDREGVPHEILNAKNHEREAGIIQQAGRRGAVTLATNMAGRGVDIILGGNPPVEAEQAAVRELGGLHVLGTERHEARRIDNQLRGRAGRQGDPGSSQFFVSLEDDLMRIFGSDRMKGLFTRLNVPEDMPIENRMVSRAIEAAQKKVEGHNFDIRKHLVEYDDVMNKHREVIYRRRNEMLNGAPDTLIQQAQIMTEAELAHLVAAHTAGDNDQHWNLEEIYESLDAIFTVPIAERVRLEDLKREVRDKADRPHARDAIVRHLSELTTRRLKELEAKLNGRETFANIIRAVFLRTLDTLWIEHLDLMTELRESIGLRGYGQRDPLVEYKREAFRHFSELTQSIASTFIHTIFKVTAPTGSTANTTTRQLVTSGPAKEASASGTTAPGVVATSTSAATSGRSQQPKVGRNDPCPCGSGKKYKKCHGA